MSVPSIYLCGIVFVYGLFVFFCRVTWMLWQTFATGMPVGM